MLLRSLMVRAWMDQSRGILGIWPTSAWRGSSDKNASPSPISSSRFYRERLYLSPRVPAIFTDYFYYFFCNTRGNILVLDILSVFLQLLKVLYFIILLVSFWSTKSRFQFLLVLELTTTLCPNLSLCPLFHETYREFARFQYGTIFIYFIPLYNICTCLLYLFLRYITIDTS